MTTKEMDAETQERIARMETSLSGLLEKLEPLPDLVKTITVLQERQNNHSSTLDMLMKRDAQLEGEHSTFKANCDRELGFMRERMALFRGIGVGVMAVCTFCSGIAVYIARSAIDNVTGRLTDVQMQVTTLNQRLTWAEFELGRKQPPKP